MPTNSDVALFILRIVVGISFIYHGWPKLQNWKGTFQWLMKEKFPLPLISTIMLCLGEVFGGALIVLGILTRPLTILMSFIMIVAFLYHLKKGDGYKMKAEVPLLLFFMLITLLIAGGGAWQLAP